MAHFRTYQDKFSKSQIRGVKHPQMRPCSASEASPERSRRDAGSSIRDLLKSSFSVAVVCISLAIGLAGCGGATSGSTESLPASSSSVQLGWIHQIEFVGFYEAVRQGYYADANLDVQINEGGFDESGAFIAPVPRVVSGESDFGVTGADVILKARAENQPVVAVAAIYQRNPIVLISLPEKNIIHPRDLIGKRVSFEPPEESPVGIGYVALLASQDIDRSQIIETPRTDFTVNPLFNDELDASPGFIISTGVEAQLREPDVNLIFLDDYGIDMYSNVIFTTEEMIKNNPALVEAFVQATIQGIQWAVDNPEKAAQNVVDLYGADQGSEFEAGQLAGMFASLPLLNPSGSAPGLMTVDAWETTHQILLDHGILDEPLDVTEAFTLEFVEKVHSVSAN
ncbi:MAG: ABC transporter substrate-binding protein [Anaerolineae bacterium]|nr:ABC transporter substrate-binding protein [Anaerolineae bacterium]